MNNQIRTTTPAHLIPDNLWQTLEDSEEANIEELIQNLEKCVSNGWFGAAAELSDSLESSINSDTSPSWVIRIALERMKRYYYLGFKNKAHIANNKVFNLLDKYETECDEQDFILWNSTILGHKSLTTRDPEIVKNFNNRCGKLRDKTLKEDERNERTSFIKATEGHYWFLKKNKNAFQIAFEEAIKISEEKNRLRSYSYIKILYAERLALFDDWMKAIQITNEFISKAHQKQFKTHLLIRALILLLKAPKGYLKEEEINNNVLRYQFLIHAMGLSQSQALYPILAQAKEIISSRANLIDFYNLDLRKELITKINNLSPSGFEKFVYLYYDSLKNCTPTILPKGETAFDLIVTYSAPDNTQYHSAIQIKSGKNTLKKDKIPESEKLQHAQNYLIDNYCINSLSAVHWFHLADITVGASNALHSRVKDKFGNNCKINMTGIDDLVVMVMRNPSLMLNVIFGNDLT